MKVSAALVDCSCVRGLMFHCVVEGWNSAAVVVSLSLSLVVAVAAAAVFHAASGRRRDDDRQADHLVS